MAYNRLNKLIMYKRVLEIVQKHYQEGISYKHIWETHVNPVYPMSYQRFIIIVNMPNLDHAIRTESERIGRKPAGASQDKRQLKLFPDNKPNNS